MELKANASLRYFNSVTSLLDDLRAETRTAKTIATVGLWLDKYARKIDRLPILNVDGDLLDYGDYVSRQMRAAGGAVKQIGIRSAAQEASIYPTFQSHGRYRGYGGYDHYGDYRSYSGDWYAETKNVAAERRAVRAKERATGASSAIAIMTEVSQATVKIRRTMTERYRIEF